MQLDFSIILDWLPAFGSALLVTLKTTVCSLILGLVISVPLSLCKISNFKPLQWFAFFYTSVFRGVPLLVQSARTTQFLITAPFLMVQPRPTMEFSTVPSIMEPLEITELETLAVSK